MSPASGRRSLGRVVERVRRRFHERTAHPGAVSVDIHTLVVPLRYDVVVRAQFFDFLVANPELSGTELVERAEQTAYARWFDHVECARYFPDLLHDRDHRDQRFAARVHGAARLLRSFEKAGFDAAHPITLISAPVDAVADSGAPAPGPLHVGDGCHRLALLMRDGATLEPWMYRVRPRLTPLVDNTSLLLRRVGVRESQYVAYLGGRFAVGDAVDLGDAIRAVGSTSAAERDVLSRVVDVQWGR